MLLKLLKYDLRSVARYSWISLVGIVACLGMTGVCGRFAAEVFSSMINIATPSIIHIILIFAAFFAYIMAIFGIYGAAFFPFATDVLVYIRFYKNLYSDEGYLTFTLPVSRKQILLSKLICGMIFSVFYAVVICIGILILLLIVPPSLGRGPINVVIYESIFTSIWEDMGAWSFLWIPVYFAEYVINMFLARILSHSMAFFCITLGAVIFKKGKALASIGCYYLFSQLTSVVGMFFAYSGGGIGMVYGLAFILVSLTPNGVMTVGALMLLLSIAMNATFAATFYFATRRLIERRLNLA